MHKKSAILILFLSLLAWPVAARTLSGGPDDAAGRRGRERSEAKPIQRGKKMVDGTGRAAAADVTPRNDAGKPPAEVLLVNKERPLPADYVPPDLRAAGIPFACPMDSPKRLLRADAAEAVERLFARAAEDGIALIGVSGYRSYARQAEIFAAQTARYGEEAANMVSARPGESEHQTGLAIDVSSPEVGGELVGEFAGTEAGRWLAEHAPAFGFIIRYPAGKEEITGYQYEPWHLRYVGTGHAVAMAAAGVALEEYMAASAG